MTTELRIRSPRGGRRAFESSLNVETLRRELTESDCLPPDAEVLYGDTWIALPDLPSQIWIEPLAHRLTAALVASDPKEIDVLARRTLRYCGDEENEAVRAAHFALAHLCLCDGRNRDAVTHLQIAARLPSTFRAVVLNNLGDAWGRLGNPEAALAAFEEAIAVHSEAIVAHLSLRNLAQTLCDERAPNLHGRPTWKALVVRESAFLSHVSEVQIRDLLGRTTFPTIDTWHVFVRRAYLPGIGSRLPRHPHGELAAMCLLETATRELGDGDFQLALILAKKAVTFDPAIKARADAVAASAAAKIEQNRQSADAQKFIDLLKKYVAANRGLGLGDLHAAQEFRALLQPYLDNDATADLFPSRVEELALAGLDGADDTGRAFLLTLAAHYGARDADAYLLAASICRANAPFREFFQALDRYDLSAAAEALDKAVGLLEPSNPFLAAARALLERLNRSGMTGPK